MSKISAKAAKHIVARVSGVDENDTVIEAAEKVIDTMKLAGFSTRAIKEAERMLAAAKARGMK